MLEVNEYRIWIPLKPSSAAWMISLARSS